MLHVKLKQAHLLATSRMTSIKEKVSYIRFNGKKKGFGKLDEQTNVSNLPYLA